MKFNDVVFQDYNEISGCSIPGLSILICIIFANNCEGSCSGLPYAFMVVIWRNKGHHDCHIHYRDNGYLTACVIFSALFIKGPLLFLFQL